MMCAGNFVPLRCCMNNATTYIYSYVRGDCACIDACMQLPCSQLSLATTIGGYLAICHHIHAPSNCMMNMGSLSCVAVALAAAAQHAAAQEASARGCSLPALQGQLAAVDAACCLAGAGGGPELCSDQSC